MNEPGSYSDWFLRHLSFCVDKAESATLFRRAAGVYIHLAKDVLPPLETTLPPEICPEVTASLASIMSLVCLAEAQVTPFLQDQF